MSIFDKVVTTSIEPRIRVALGIPEHLMDVVQVMRAYPLPNGI
jgi:hypothetical protein